MKLLAQFLIVVTVVSAFIGLVTHPWPGWAILGALLAGGGGLVWAAGGEQRRIAARRKTAELETAVGMPLVEGLENCAECGKPLVAGAKFCSYCRTLTPNGGRGVCVRCGARNQPDASWCSSCGERVDGKAPKGVLSLEPPSQTSLAPSARQRRP